MELEPLTDEEMVALLNSLAPGLGERILARINREECGRHARGLIRAAGQAWLKAAGTEAPPAAVVPVELPVDEPFVIDQCAPENLPPANVTAEPEVAPLIKPSPAVSIEETPSEPPPQATPNPDRVDELLRQFRERYGRGSV